MTHHFADKRWRLHAALTLARFLTCAVYCRLIVSLLRSGSAGSDAVSAMTSKRAGLGSLQNTEAADGQWPHNSNATGFVCDGHVSSSEAQFVTWLCPARHHQQFAKRGVLSSFLECSVVCWLPSERPSGVYPFGPALPYASLK